MVQNWDFHNPSSTRSINQCTAPRTILRSFTLLLTQIIYAPFKIENPYIFFKIKAASSYNVMAEFWFWCLLLTFSYVVIRVSAFGIHFLYFHLQKEKELQKLTQEEINFKSLVRDLFQKVEEAKSSLAMNRSRGKVLDAIIQEKKSGRIPGIYGRLVK